MSKTTFFHSLLFGHVVVILANLIFGGNIPVASQIMSGSEITAISMAMMRVYGAGALFWLVSLFLPREKVSLKDLGVIFLASIFGILFNQMFFIYGLSKSSPIEASIASTCTPLFTMILALIFQKEMLSFKKVLGVVLGLCGAIIILVNSHHASSVSMNFLGISICLASSISYAIYLTAFKRIVKTYSAVTLMKWMFTFSSLLITPVAWHDFQQIDFVNLPPYIYALLAYSIVGATFITYFLIPTGQKILRPTTLSTYNCTRPIIASTIAIMIGIDQFQWIKLWAAVLVILGVYIVSKSKARVEEVPLPNPEK